jgi:hypothetical protein
MNKKILLLNDPVKAIEGRRYLLLNLFNYYE